MIYRASLLQGAAGGHRGPLLRPDQAVPEGREPADVRAGRVPGGCRLPQPPHEGHNPLRYTPYMCCCPCNVVEVMVCFLHVVVFMTSA